MTSNRLRDVFWVDAIIKTAVGSGVLVLLVFSFLFGSVSGYDNTIAYLSVLFFGFFLLFGLYSEYLYWFFLPVIVLFTPNSINDFFPALPMAVGSDAPYFSFFTHIDIYLVIGCLRYCEFSKKIAGLKVILLGSVLFVYLLTVLLAIFSNWMTSVMIGIFQLRYYFLILLLFVYASPLRYESFLFRGVVLSLGLVLMEATVFTSVGHVGRLTSGNYGVNTLGHLMAAGAALLVFYPTQIVRRMAVLLVAGLFIYGVVETETRFSLIALLVSSCYVICAKRGKLSWLILGGVFSIAILYAFLLFVPAGQSLMSGIDLVLVNYRNPYLIPVTPESSSMVTRLILWWGTVDIINDYFWLGAGPGVWTHLKDIYGIPFEAVLDPHQDILSYLVSYGIVIGAIFYCSVFVLPLFYARKYSLDKSSIWCWVAFLTVFLVAGVSNAVTWKHQIAAIVYISSLIIMFWKVRDAREPSVE